jgi:hypothetical protein
MFKCLLNLWSWLQYVIYWHHRYFMYWYSDKWIFRVFWDYCICQYESGLRMVRLKEVIIEVFRLLQACHLTLISKLHLLFLTCVFVPVAHQCNSCQALQAWGTNHALPNTNPTYPHLTSWTARLTPWSRILPEQLIVCHLLKKLSAFC